MSDLMTYEETARLLRRSESTLRKDVAMRRIPVLKPFGKRGKVLFSRQALSEWLAAAAVEPRAGK